MRCYGNLVSANNHVDSPLMNANLTLYLPQALLTWRPNPAKGVPKVQVSRRSPVPWPFFSRENAAFIEKIRCGQYNLDENINFQVFQTFLLNWMTKRIQPHRIKPWWDGEMGRGAGKNFGFPKYFRPIGRKNLLKQNA